MTDTAYQKLYWGSFDQYVEFDDCPNLTESDFAFMETIATKLEGMLYGRDPDPGNRKLELSAYSKVWEPFEGVEGDAVVYAFAVFMFDISECFLFNVEIHPETTQWVDIGGSLQRFVESIRESVHDMEQYPW